ncbi:MAG: AAA family ATPase [Rhizobacter sp.]|nr:AAA family ATPase [Rhizobacter sp.]
MANKTDPGVLPASPTPTRGSVIGFDVENFSRYVAETTAQHGPRAGELAATTLMRGEQAVTRILRDEGYEFIDSMGDGALYFRAEIPHPRQSEALVERLRAHHHRQCGLWARFAQVEGGVNVHSLPVHLTEHRRFVWGDGLARLHDSLNHIRAQQRSRKTVRPVSPALRSEMRSGEVVDIAFLFLKLLDAGRWRELDTYKLDHALHGLVEWARGIGAQLDRLAHDEKGVHLRLSAPAWAGVEGWTTHAATPLVMLREHGFDQAAAALAIGPVYRGTWEGATRVVHGAAINRAAKLCASLPAGAIEFDTSVDAYQLLRRQGHDTCAFVGRSRVLQDALDWLSREGPRAITLQGVAGIGKSAVLKNLLDQLSSSTTLTASARGTPASLFQPHAIVIALLQSALHSCCRDDDEELQLIAQALAGEPLSAELQWLCKEMLHNTEDERPVKLLDVSPDERRVLAERALVAVFAELGRRRHRMVLAIDDMHWCDGASQTVLAQCLQYIDRLRIVSSARTMSPLAPHSRSDLPENTLLLDIGPLSCEELQALVDAAGLPYPPQLSPEQLHSLCGGNPFHALQALLALGSNGDRTLQSIKSFDLTLDARLDALAPAELDVLRILALHDGSVRWEDVQAILRRLTPEGDAQAGAELRSGLVRNWYARPGLADDTALEIDHQLMRGALMRRMPAGVIRLWSQAAARNLQHRFRHEPASGHLPEMGRLWRQAGQAGRAAVCFERAGLAAKREGAYSAAVPLLDLAIATTPTTRRAVRWFAERASAQWALGNVEKGNESARQALAQARSVQALSARLRANALTAAAIRVETGQFLGRLPDIIGGAIDTARYALGARDIQLARGRAIGSLAYVCALLRLAPAAAALYRLGESIGIRDGHLLPSAYVLASRAVWRFMHARWTEGDADLSRALERITGLKEPQIHEVIETLRGLGAHLQGDLPRAIVHFERVTSLASARGHVMHEAWGRYAKAQTLLAARRADEAWPLLCQAQAGLSQVSDRQSQLICLGLRSRLALARGDVDEALRSAAAAGAQASTLPPTNFSSTEGYAAAAHVGALLELAGPTAAHRDAGHQLRRQHAAVLNRYAMFFPIARPRKALVEALVLAHAQRARASQAATEAARRAARLGMSAEADMGHRVAAALRGTHSLNPMEMI